MAQIWGDRLGKLEKKWGDEKNLRTKIEIILIRKLRK